MPMLVRSRQAAAGRVGRRTPLGGVARALTSTHRLRCARCGSDCGDRRCAPTPLRCSSRGRAAKLTSRASLAPFGHSPRVRSTKRASRAAPETPLLGAAEVAAPGAAQPVRAVSARATPPRGVRRPARPAAACRSSVCGDQRGAVGESSQFRDRPSAARRPSTRRPRPDSACRPDTCDSQPAAANCSRRRDDQECAFFAHFKQLGGEPERNRSSSAHFGSSRLPLGRKCADFARFDFRRSGGRAQDRGHRQLRAARQDQRFSRRPQSTWLTKARAVCRGRAFAQARSAPAPARARSARRSSFSRPQCLSGASEARAASSAAPPAMQCSVPRSAAFPGLRIWSRGKARTAAMPGGMARIRNAATRPKTQPRKRRGARHTAPASQRTPRSGAAHRRARGRRPAPLCAQASRAASQP